MTDFSNFSDDDLDQLANNNISGLSDEALQSLVAGRPVEPTTLSKIGNFLGSNAEIPGSVAGGLAGAAAGTAILPGIGTVIGGILGGATGAFGGSIASDVYNDEAVSFENALKEGAISAGFDVATLGAGKLLKPLASRIGINTSDLFVNIMGRNPTKPAPILADLPTNVAAGSQDSLRLTQQLLEESGGSLSAVQTGQANVMRALSEEISEIGIISGNRTAQRVANNNLALTNEVQRLVDGIDPSLARGSDAVGEEIYGIVEGGRRAASQLYGEGLDKITQEYGTKNISLSKLRTLTRAFNNQNFNEITGDILAPQVRTLVNTLEEGVLDVPSARLSSLLEVDRVIGNAIDQAMPGNQMANANAVRQLSEFRTQFRNALDGTLARQAEPARRAYNLLKKNYGDSSSSILPKMNQSAVRAAADGDYDRLGNLLIKQTNVSKINAMMKSIDQSFADIAKANIGKTGDDIITTGVGSADRAKALLRQSYARQLFTDVQGEGTDFKNFRALAHRLNRGDSLGRSKAIMGESFGSYRRLVNAIADSTVDNKRGLFNLALRSQEINAAAKIGQIGGSVAAGTMVGLPLAAAILTIPSVLGHIATNKRAVNRLINLNGVVKRSTNVTPELITSGLAKVFAELSTEEQESLNRQLRVSNPQ